ncbi:MULTISPECIES: ATP-binding protein [Sphingobacterium]|uniref:ATP-binding protein n=1 Tax=Sphingobacterium TaxID=28453 RepID=UPI00257FBE00|nr:MULTISPECIES: ATP-binding protein [Sphingobacterium]
MNIEILRLQERIEIALDLGESHYREFKSGQEGPPEKKVNRDIKTVCEDIARTLVAFANADGGELLVGVEDSGHVSGLNYPNDKIETLLNAPKTHVHKNTPLPNYKARDTEYKGKKILYFSIPKGNEYVYLTSRGSCIQRKDLESVPISSEEIVFSRQEAISREYDRNFVENASIADIDIELLQNITEQLSIKITPEKFLQHLDLAEFDGNKLRLKRAALLLFAHKPNKWHPRLQVRVIKVADTELKSGEDFNVVNDEEISDNILRLIESSWEIIRPYLTETKFSKQAIFKTQIVYPELACREALINAIAHRDYSIEGRGIEVYVYTDRLEIQSPGELLSSIKIDDIEKQTGAHQSRNSNVAKALREVGYMRELGEGIRRIFELMRNNDLESPHFESKNKSFKVTLSQKHIYSKAEKLWLDNFCHLNLSREQKTVVRLGTNGTLFSTDDIWESCGIVDTDKYRQLLESLTQLGILKRNFDRNKAYAIAKKTSTSKKEIKQFEIIVPPTFKSNSVKINLSTSINKSETDMLDDFSYTKVFIPSIPFKTNKKELTEFFNQFGEVVSVVIPRNFQTKSPRGFAYIEYATSENATNAIQNSSKYELNGKKIVIRTSDRKR